MTNFTLPFLFTPVDDSNGRQRADQAYRACCEQWMTDSNGRLKEGDQPLSRTVDDRQQMVDLRKGTSHCPELLMTDSKEQLPRVDQLQSAIPVSNS